MSKLLLILSAILGLAAAGVGFINKQRAHETAQALAETEESLTKTKEDLAAKEKSLAEAEEKRKVAEQEKEEVTRSLQVAKNEVKALSEQIASVKSEIAEKDQKINDLSTVIEQMKAVQPSSGGGEAIAGSPAAEIETLKTEKAELEQLNQSLTAKLEQAESQVKAMAEAEKARQEGIMRKGLEGRVLAVNSAWGFVVLSVGDRQRVAQGAEMIIRRGGNMIGKVKITSVEPSQSVADILPDTVAPGMQVQPGDVAIFPGS